MERARLGVRQKSEKGGGAADYRGAGRPTRLAPRYRRRLKTAYFQALSLARADRILRALAAAGDRVLVLNFHRVSPERNPFWPPMTPEAFADLAGYLAATCQVLTFAELPEMQPDRRPKVILSFDDGYRDFVEHAVPILARHGLRANQNLIAQSVESGRPPWMIQLVDALNAVPLSRLRELAIPGLEVPRSEEDELAKTNYGTQLTALLQALTPEERSARFEDLVNLVAETDPDQFTAMMSRRDAEEILPGHEIGGHSYSHETMSRFGEAEFASDIDRCQRLFAELSVPMKIFAFPYGSFRPEQVRILRNRGVEHVLLVGERPSRIGDGVYTRITMYGDSSSELRMRALGHQRPSRQRAGDGSGEHRQREHDHHHHP